MSPPPIARDVLFVLPCRTVDPLGVVAAVYRMVRWCDEPADDIREAVVEMCAAWFGVSTINALVEASAWADRIEKSGLLRAT